MTLNSYLTHQLPDHLKGSEVITKEIILTLMNKGLPLGTISFHSELTISELTNIYNSGLINFEMEKKSL